MSARPVCGPPGRGSAPTRRPGAGSRRAASGRDGPCRPCARRPPAPVPPPGPRRPADASPRGSPRGRCSPRWARGPGSRRDRRGACPSRHPGRTGVRAAYCAVMAMDFPAGFLWGTATAAHQVEGGNWNNDWWAWEHNPDSPCVESSGDACDHFWRYPGDLRLLAELGFSAYRFSLEWSRIEPAEGEWSKGALDHYRRMCATCLENGLVPIVTFHHFTTPRWAAHLGGWEIPDTADRFARYCEKAAAHLGDLMGWACTFNEPNIVATMGYLAGVFPPGRRDAGLRRAVTDILIDAHRKSGA